MSYKAEFSDDGGRYYASNAIRLGTKEEAEGYARNLFNRWLGATDYRVVESADPVNYVWENGKLNRWCECSPEYGPCEKHCDLLVSREGASLHSADELLLLLVSDLVDCGTKLTEYDRAEYDRLRESLTRDSYSGIERFPEPKGDKYSDFEAAADLEMRVRSYAPSDLWINQDDGYTIVRPHSDCPLLNGDS